MGLAYEEQVAEHVAKRPYPRSGGPAAAISGLLHLLPQSAASACSALCTNARAATPLTPTAKPQSSESGRTTGVSTDGWLRETALVLTVKA